VKACLGQSRPGEARRSGSGWTWSVSARRGRSWRSTRGASGQGMAGRVMAWRLRAWRGETCPGRAWRRWAVQADMVRRVAAVVDRIDRARPGVARPAMSRRSRSGVAGPVMAVRSSRGSAGTGMSRFGGQCAAWPGLARPGPAGHGGLRRLRRD